MGEDDAERYARVLSVLSDPGRATRDGKGSGFLCIENNDPTAAKQCSLFEAHGIEPRWVLPWNAYPWFIDKAPTAAQRNDGAMVLGELIELISPSPKVVLLQGGQAVDVWKRVLALRPTVVQDRVLVVIETIHPSPNALRPPDRVVRRSRLLKQERAYRAVADALQETNR